MWPIGRRVRGVAKGKEREGRGQGEGVRGVAKGKEREGRDHRGWRVQSCACLPTYV